MFNLFMMHLKSIKITGIITATMLPFLSEAQSAALVQR